MVTYSNKQPGITATNIEQDPVREIWINMCMGVTCWFRERTIDMTTIIDTYRLVGHILLCRVCCLFIKSLPNHGDILNIVSDWQ